MKIFLLLSAIAASTSLSAQFKTQYHSNGDPKTEIIDAIGMKQGAWNFYDHQDKLYKKETYQDNLLQSRSHIIGSKEINSILFKEISISLNSFKNISGELILDKNQNIYKLFYYSKNSNTKIDEKALKIEVDNLIDAKYKNEDRVIFSF